MHNHRVANYAIAAVRMHRCWCNMYTAHKGQNACQAVQLMADEQQGPTANSAQHLGKMNYKNKTHTLKG